MENEVLCAASHYNKSYYLNPLFSKLPLQVQKEIRVKCVLLAEEIEGIVTIGFYEDSTVFVESSHSEKDLFSIDEINTRLAVDAFVKDNSELFSSLKLWHLSFFNVNE